MKTHDMILSVLKQMENNIERKEFLNSILNDKNIPKDDLRKIACKTFIESNFVDKYFSNTIEDIVKLRLKKLRRFFKKNSKKK